MSRRQGPDLAGLREKYQRILALRVADEAAPGPADAAVVSGASGASAGSGAPAEEMRALALRWPGSLRELDQLPLDDLRARLAAVDRAIADASSVEPWMLALDAFHRLAREALAAKRWLGKRKRVDAAIVSEFEATAPADARAWTGALADVAAPPGGRLMAVVHARVAVELGLSPDEARLLVLGPSALRRAGRSR